MARSVGMAHARIPAERFSQLKFGRARVSACDFWQPRFSLTSRSHYEGDVSSRCGCCCGRHADGVETLPATNTQVRTLPPDCWRCWSHPAGLLAELASWVATSMKYHPTPTPAHQPPKYHNPKSVEVNPAITTMTIMIRGIAAAQNRKLLLQKIGGLSNRG
jgi:hypothetical protein